MTNLKLIPFSKEYMRYWYHEKHQLNIPVSECQKRARIDFNAIKEEIEHILRSL